MGPSGPGPRVPAGVRGIKENIRFLRLWQLLGVLFWLAFSVAASKTVSALFWTPRHMVLELRAGSRVPQFFTINPCLAFGPLQKCCSEHLFLFGALQ